MHKTSRYVYTVVNSCHTVDNSMSQMSNPSNLVTEMWPLCIRLHKVYAL